MNYFENQIFRSGIIDTVDTPWDLNDEVARLSGGQHPVHSTLTQRIDVSAANTTLARIRREERQQIEAEIQEYIDALDLEEWDEELFLENNDESLLDFVIETRRNTAKSRKKDKRSAHHNHWILKEVYYCNTDEFRSRRVRANKARLSEIEGKKVWKKINHKIPRRNPDLAGKVGNKEYWMW